MILAGENHAEKDVGRFEVRAEAEGGGIFGDGLVEVAAVFEFVAEEEVGLGIIGFNPECLLKEGDGFVVATVLCKETAECGDGEIVVGNDFGGVFKEGAGVSPIGELDRGGDQQGGGGKGGNGAKGKVITSGEFGCAPDENNEEADQREISVTIGPGLVADLDEADDGDEGAEDPEPAGEQPRAGAAESQCEE